MNLNLTEQGLRYNEIVIENNEETGEERYASEVLTDISLAHSKYKEKNDGEAYVKLNERINAFFTPCFPKVTDILEKQVTNEKLNPIGWTFLTKLVVYLAKEAYTYKNNVKDWSNIDKLRNDLSTYFNSNGFVSTSEVSEERMTSLTTSRNEHLEEIKKELDSLYIDLSTETVFTQGLYADRCLLDQVLKLLLFKPVI